MKPFSVVIQASAERDIREALTWIQRRSPARAAKWIDQLESAIGTLGEAPLRCPLAEEGRHFEEEIRHLIWRMSGARQAYRILFTIRGHAVHILHVRHCRRLPLEPN
jgi:plasmid stabilization system protein ParE